MVVGAGRRLTKDDWVTAGLAALNQGGPAAVAIEPIATTLGTTKGSGYWHWGSRAALLDAVLGRWREVATRDVIDAVEAGGGSASARLERLLAVVTESTERHPGTLTTLVDADPPVRRAVQEVSRQRVSYVAGLLTAAGVPPPESGRRALLAYAAYLGHAQLATTTPDMLPRSDDARRALRNSLIDIVLSAEPR